MTSAEKKTNKIYKIIIKKKERKENKYRRKEWNICECEAKSSIYKQIEQNYYFLLDMTKLQLTWWTVHRHRHRHRHHRRRRHHLHRHPRIVINYATQREKKETAIHKIVVFYLIGCLQIVSIFTVEIY